MKYISLLRGVNVSGKNKIKMPELKFLYESLDLKNVETYIQSGNVIFETKDKSISNIKSLIENTIKNKFKFKVPVEIRTKLDLKNIIKNNPFGTIDLENEGTKVLVTFLATKPNKDKITDLNKYVKLPEKLNIKGKEVYLYCPNGYGKSKLSNTFIEKKLEVAATTRNWKSVVKLYELST
ncbi:MAG: DUF1697 domain-containing protein [Gammaproteobacteria bacterium]